MSSGTAGFGLDVEGLRERLPHQPEAPVKAETVNVAQDAVKELNEQQASEGKDEKDKKTFGRTPDGTGAYTRPSFSGPRASNVWYSQPKYDSKRKKATNRARPPRLITSSPQLTILMP
jgi:hypothetical protein